MEFNRKELKTNAKQVLRKTYLMALVMSIILCIAGATAYQSPSSNSDTTEDSGYELNIPTDEYGLPPMSYTMNDLLNSVGVTNSLMNKLFGALSVVGFLTSLLAFAAFMVVASSLFRLLAGFHLEIGARKYFLDTAQGQQSGMGRLKYGFTSGAYGKIIAAMFFRALFTFLWTLLFIIPGVIKMFSYSMVPYILADNPHLGRKRVLELSRQMTDGFKMKIFVLHLSFIGWNILGTLLFTVGQILVWPYIDATFAQLYVKLRENAISRSITTKEELNLA